MTDSGHLNNMATDTDEAVKAFVDAVYGAPSKDAKREPRKDEIVRLFHEGVGQDLSSAKGTAWGLWNALTEYETHAAREESSAKNVGGRLNGLAFGQNGSRIAKGFDALRILADARPGIDVGDIFGAGSEVVERVDRARIA